ncbi:MAG: alpha-amylase family glycosyl hydrolase [Pseudomonadota bacterium]
MSSVETTQTLSTSQTRALSQQEEWWRGAIIYQIYPRSFLDTNNDGIGDLRGVVKGLDYVASLGVDAIWLSPFFTSPMNDYGYDISDYCDVDPIFGALSDFDAVIEKAHHLKLKVIIDQVYSHTSDQHAWFEESRQDQTNPKADWYVWADPKPDGSPPTNWQSVFGGAAWEWDSRRKQYYLHNFLKTQPDLNVHNIAVQNALLDVSKFWLDRGVDGFRLDALNFAMHDPQLRDNPPAPDDDSARTRPFDYQLHHFNQSHPDIPKFLERIRTLTNKYDSVFTVAEVGGPTPLKEMKAFTEQNTRLNSAYDFSFLYANLISNTVTKEAVKEWKDGSHNGWPSWAFSNHDAPRAISRWAPPGYSVQAAKLYLLLLLSLRGNAFIYQGEELGLPQSHVPFESLKDPEAIANWPLTLGRDGARTPIPWNANEPNAGFSDAVPWLPVDQHHFPLAISNQEAQANSVLQFCREVFALRKNTPVLRSGDLNFVEESGGLLAFYRKLHDREALCVFNLSAANEYAWRPLSEKRLERVISVSVESELLSLPEMLKPLSGYVALRKS